MCIYIYIYSYRGGLLRVGQQAADVLAVKGLLRQPVLHMSLSLTLSLYIYIYTYVYIYIYTYIHIHIIDI